MTTNDPALPPNEVFAVDFAQLAREIAMDIFPIDEVLRLHQLTPEEWERIATHPKFKQMLDEMVREWNLSAGTMDRVKVKSATGLESTLEVFIRDIANPDIPLNQRVEAGKFLAKLGELDGSRIGQGGGGSIVHININTGHGKEPVTIEAKRLEPENVE